MDDWKQRTATSVEAALSSASVRPSCSPIACLCLRARRRPSSAKPRSMGGGGSDWGGSGGRGGEEGREEGIEAQSGIGDEEGRGDEEEEEEWREAEEEGEGEEREERTQPSTADRAPLSDTAALSGYEGKEAPAESTTTDGDRATPPSSSLDRGRTGSGGGGRRVGERRRGEEGEGGALMVRLPLEGE
jgi:hypothetical protein